MRYTERTLTVHRYGTFTVYVYEIPEGGYVAAAAGDQGVPTTQAPSSAEPPAQSVQAALNALRRLLEHN